MAKRKRKGGAQQPLVPSAKKAKKEQQKQDKPAAGEGTSKKHNNKGNKDGNTPAPSASPDPGKEMLGYLVGPTSVESFFGRYWEKDVLIVKSSHRSADENKPKFACAFREWAQASGQRPHTVSQLAPVPVSTHRFSNLFNRAMLHDAMVHRGLKFGHHLNVAQYVPEEGVRKTLTPDVSPADPAVVWDMYNNGATLQVFQPQQYCDSLLRVVEGIERIFGCLAGCNAYITPPNSQGLAPHHDDVEVFILQVEGQKRWKLHAPIAEDLPREYSPDLSQEEAGPTTHDITLNEGDFMYFPRGVVHQAMTSSHGSTHLTISVFQKHAWFDMVSASLTSAMDKAFVRDRAMREGLPVDYLNFLGTGVRDVAKYKKKRTSAEERFKQLLATVVANADLHQAADEMALDFVFNRLAPASDHNDLEYHTAPPATARARARAFKGPEPQPGQAVRLRHPSFMRMVMETGEDGKPVVELYHSLSNLRNKHMNDPKSNEDDDLLDTDGSEGEGEGESEEGENGAGGENEPKGSKGSQGEGKEEEEDEGDDDDDEDDEDDDEDEDSQEAAGDAPPCLTYPPQFAPCLAMLFANHPAFTPIKSLPIQSPDDKMSLVMGLLLEGLAELK